MKMTRRDLFRWLITKLRARCTGQRFEKIRTMTPEQFPQLLKTSVELQMAVEDGMLIGRNEDIGLIVVFHDPENLDETFYLDMEVLIACYFHEEPFRLSAQCQRIKETLKEVLADKAQSKDYEYRYL